VKEEDDKRKQMVALAALLCRPDVDVRRRVSETGGFWLVPDEKQPTLLRGTKEIEVGVFRGGGDRVAECWLVPFDLYAFDEIWR